MARKENTVERRIAQEYRVWLRSHPNASTQTQLRAFDRIADKHLARVEEKVAA